MIPEAFIPHTWVLASAVCATTKDIYSKSVSAVIPPALSAFTSFACALPYYVVLLACFWAVGLEDFVIQPGFFLWVFLRSVSDLGAETLKMYALKTSDLSLVAAFLALSPVIALITSPLITGDALTARVVVGLLIVVFGSLVLIYEPWKGTGADRKTRMRGILFSLGASFCFSLNNCFDRLAVQSASPTLSAAAVTLGAGIFLVPAAVKLRAEWKFEAGVWPKLWGRGLFEVLFMVTKLIAMQSLSAPVVMGLQRVSTVLNVVSGKVLFKEERFWQRLAGTALIVVGVVVCLVG